MVRAPSTVSVAFRHLIRSDSMSSVNRSIVLTRIPQAGHRRRRSTSLPLSAVFFVSSRGFFLHLGFRHFMAPPFASRIPQGEAHQVFGLVPFPRQRLAGRVGIAQGGAQSVESVEYLRDFPPALPPAIVLDDRSGPFSLELDVPGPVAQIHGQFEQYAQRVLQVLDRRAVHLDQDSLRASPHGKSIVSHGPPFAGGHYSSTRIPMR